MIRRFLFLAALAASAPSWSAVTLSNFPPNPGVLPGGGWQFTPGTTFANPPPARAWTNGVYGGAAAAVVTDTFSLKGPAAGALSVAVATSATAANIAKALAGVAGRLYLPLTVGMAAYDLLAASGVRQGATGAEIDSGESPTTRSVTTYTANSKSGPNSAAACSAAAAAESPNMYSVPNPSGSGYVYTLGYMVGRVFDIPGYNTYCYVDSYDSTGKLAQERFRTFTVNSSTSNQLACSSQIDALTGQSYTPGTYSDGKCITGRYTAATDAQVIARVSPGVQADPSAAAKAAADAGASIESSPYSVSGPASQSGTSTSKTTTGPAGTTTVTTTPTYNYTYAGDTITINTTNTTNTTNVTNEGDTTTTTETTTTPGNDDKGMCSLYPDSLACMKPGTPPDAEQIPIDRRPVTITKDPRWASNAGACTRGAIQLTSGASINLWQPFCDFFALIRGVVVGMFGLAGAFIFRNGVK